MEIIEVKSKNVILRFKKKGFCGQLKMGNLFQKSVTGWLPAVLLKVFHMLTCIMTMQKRF